MKRTAARIQLRRLGWIGILAALFLGSFAREPAAPAQDQKRDKDKPAAEKTKKERPKIEPPPEKQPPEAEPRFTLRGGFVHGVLLQRQEQVHQLASLIFPAAGAQAQDYQVRIDWGDHSGATCVQIVEQKLGYFKVTGRHVYAVPGRYKVRICVTGPDGATSATTSAIEVGDMYAGIREDWTAATFPAPVNGSAGDNFQAVIDWGDGTPCTAGLVCRDGEVLRVRACHAYTLDGPYTMSVLVMDSTGVRLASKRRVRVVRPSVTFTTHRIPAKPGERFDHFEIVTFQVSNRLATAREFAAVINWGDGSPPEKATVVGSGGTFRVLASHTYGPGWFRYTVSILQMWH